MTKVLLNYAIATLIIISLLLLCVKLLKVILVLYKNIDSSEEEEDFDVSIEMLKMKAVFLGGLIIPGFLALKNLIESTGISAIIVVFIVLVILGLTFFSEWLRNRE